MAVSILFPDDTIRDVPGQLVTRPGSGSKQAIFIQVPINCDPMWRYCQIEGQWRAVPRHGANVAILTPSLREWWDSIDQMQDRADPESNVA